MRTHNRLLTLDSNVFIAALKGDERYSKSCQQVLDLVPHTYILTEPSIVYQEVCGTLARKVGLEAATEAERQLGRIIHPRLLVNCDREFCLSTYTLCAEYGIYAIDAIYLKVALQNNSLLASLDRDDFIDRVRKIRPGIEAYHVSELPY